MKTHKLCAEKMSSDTVDETQYPRRLCQEINAAESEEMRSHNLLST